MGFRRYTATVTYVSSVLSLKQRQTKVTLDIRSSQPLEGVNDLAFLHALAKLPANSQITEVNVAEVAA